MDAWLITLLVLGTAWLFAGAVFGRAGGFAIIRAVEMGLEPKSKWYWITLVVLYPIILLRAAWWAFLATCGYQR